MDTIRDSMFLEGYRVTATVSLSGLLHWEPEHQSWHRDARGALDLKNDVVGFTKRSQKIILYTFNQRSANCCAGTPRRKERDVTLEFDDRETHRAWCDVLQRIYDNSETQYRLHAKEIALSLDLSMYDGIVCVSGDGVLTEVLNGLLERPDWDQAIKTPLGIVPAGTGNGMAMSLLEAGNEHHDSANATFAIIRGCKQPLDVATVTQGQVKYHSILMLSWGFVADVDFESEKLRSIGDLRLDLWAVVRVVCLREYNGTLAYIPASRSYKVGETPTGLERSYLLESRENSSDRSWSKGGYTGPSESPAPSEWLSIEGTFVFVWAQNVPYAAEDLIPAPKAKFNDGCFDLVVIRECPRWKLVSILLSMKTGRHIKSEYVQYLKVKAFRLSPGGIVGGTIQGGYVDLDGEVLARGQGAYGDNSSDPMEYGPTIDVIVEKGLASIYVPPIS